jgi:hypothetical protein
MGTQKMNNTTLHAEIEAARAAFTNNPGLATVQLSDGRQIHRSGYIGVCAHPADDFFLDDHDGSTLD